MNRALLVIDTHMHYSPFGIVPIKKVHFIASSTHIWMYTDEFKESTCATFFNAYDEGSWKLSGGFKALFTKKTIFRRYIRLVSIEQRHYM